MECFWNFEGEPIVFTDEDLEIVDLPHVDPLVIKLSIGNAIVSRVLVDGGSNMDIMFWSALQRMGINKWLISPVSTQIHVFDGAKVTPVGTITLPIYTTYIVLMVKFFIIDTLKTVNAIMGREWIHLIKGIVSTLHQVLRCQSPNRLYTINIKGDQTRNHGCFSLGSEGKVKILSDEQIKRLKKGRTNEGEELSEDMNK